MPYELKPGSGSWDAVGNAGWATCSCLDEIHKVELFSPLRQG